MTKGQLCENRLELLFQPSKEATQLPDAEQDNGKAVTVTLNTNNMQFNDRDSFSIGNSIWLFGERALREFRFTYRLIDAASSGIHTGAGT